MLTQKIDIGPAIFICFVSSLPGGMLAILFQDSMGSSLAGIVIGTLASWVLATILMAVAKD